METVKTVFVGIGLILVCWLCVASLNAAGMGALNQVNDNSGSISRILIGFAVSLTAIMIVCELPSRNKPERDDVPINNF